MVVKAPRSSVSQNADSDSGYRLEGRSANWPRAQLRQTSPRAAAPPLSLSGEGLPPRRQVVRRLSVYEAPSPDRERGRAAAGGEVSRAHAAAGGEVSGRLLHGVTHAAVYISQAEREASRAARRAPTAAEALAWSLVRDRRCLGVKFRREQVVEGFRVDLYCAELRLAIELDGGVHDDPEQRAYDAARTRVLGALGICVMRVRNEDVSRETLERCVRVAREARRL